MDRGVTQAALFDEAMVADECGMAGDDCLCPAAGYGLELYRGRQRNARLDRSRQNRAADRVLRSRLETRGDFKNVVDRRLVQRNHFDNVRHTFRERAGLVECNASNSTDALEVNAARSEERRVGKEW